MSKEITAAFLRAIPTPDAIARSYFCDAAHALDVKDQQIAWLQRLREASREHTVREVAAAEAARNRAQAALRSVEDREQAALDTLKAQEESPCKG